MKAIVTAVHDLAPEVRQIDLQVPGSKQFHFAPGQFISVEQEIEGRQITRAYSIASPPNGNSLSLCLNRVSEGLVSPYLFTLKPGDTFEIHEPLGYFTLRRPDRAAVFVATGTGIAPFRSMLLHHLPRNPPGITLLFGVRYERSLLYNSELNDLAVRHSSFRFLPTVSRPTEDWFGRTGRVQQHLDEALTRNGVVDIPNTDVYICGMKEMVDDVRAELKRRGFDRKQIIYEKYD